MAGAFRELEVFATAVSLNDAERMRFPTRVYVGRLFSIFSAGSFCLFGGWAQLSAPPLSLAVRKHFTGSFLGTRSHTDSRKTHVLQVRAYLNQAYYFWSPKTLC